MFELAIVVAVAENGVIGKGNALPWRLPGDLRYFKELTMGHPIIMGRKTYDSIGRPLPGRVNIVVTGNTAWRAEGALVAPDLEQAIELARKNAVALGVKRAMLVGGATLYSQALPQCGRLYITEVHAEVGGNVYFPPFDRALWREVSRRRCEADGANAHAHSFTVLERQLLPAMK